MIASIISWYQIKLPLDTYISCSKTRQVLQDCYNLKKILKRHAPHHSRIMIYLILRFISQYIMIFGHSMLSDMIFLITLVLD